MDSDESTYRVIGAAMEAHKELGHGFLESVYQEALAHEFSTQGIPYVEQASIRVMFKGAPLNKTFQADFLCFDDIVVEIKAMRALSSNEDAQLLNYLKATRYPIGVLINFGARSLEYKRRVFTP